VRIVDAKRLERGRERAVKARATADRRPYFQGVAQARYVLRKVFRLVEEEDVAERLDITPAFASSLVKTLAVRGLIATKRDKLDSRVNWVQVTKEGRALLHRIDEQVQIHVDYFTRGLTSADTEAALSILMFYAGVSLKPAAQKAE
jgi:DNA-binding MarR family transcriptional regulator